MTFEIGQRVNVAPLSEHEAQHEIIGKVIKVLGSGYTGSEQDWYIVLLDNHLYGMDKDEIPEIDVPEMDLTVAQPVPI